MQKLTATMRRRTRCNGVAAHQHGLRQRGRTALHKALQARIAVRQVAVDRLRVHPQQQASKAGEYCLRRCCRGRAPAVRWRRGSGVEDDASEPWGVAEALQRGIAEAVLRATARPPEVSGLMLVADDDDDVLEHQEQQERESAEEALRADDPELDADPDGATDEDHFKILPLVLQMLQVI